MESLLDFARFACSEFWVFLGSTFILCIVVYFVTNLILRVWVKLLRSLNVLFRGWPPAHLDADGDFKPIKTEQNEPTN